MYIKDLNNLSKKDVMIAGGKGAFLGELIHLSLSFDNTTAMCDQVKIAISVPSGYVILATGFERFLKETNLIQKLKAQLDNINYEEILSVVKVSEIVRELINNKNIPDDIEQEILKNFRKLKSKYVAVRSSSTCEDSRVNSWAGELESYLNVNEDSLLENVKKCWSSLFTPRAILYRHKRCPLKKEGNVAVVIQKMIQAEVSGVCFTVHPVTEDKNLMVVEAGYGLGGAIVGGKITPDTYILSKFKKRSTKFKTELAIIDRNISNQGKMIIRGKEGIKEKVVSVSRRKKQKLSDNKLLDLAKICLKIEKHFKKPQDIEWCLKNGQLYFVQSRPITTLRINFKKKKG
mgnify:CR=1 FL=1